MLAELQALAERLNKAKPTSIGFPGAVDFDYSPLATFFTHHMLNNIGDPAVDGRGANHTKSMEREVVALVADLLRAPADDRWGYVTTGASEGNLYALYLARQRHPSGIVYHSRAAHYSVGKALKLLAMPSTVVHADDHGEMDYNDLRAHIESQRDRPAIVVANIGTTMTEAVDDIRRITTILDELGIDQRFVHADAALTGLPLALLEDCPRPGFDFADGADSVIISGHKFIGSPMPCGVVVVKAHHRPDTGPEVAYIGTTDTTITGSRSGHAPLLLWYALRHYGIEGLRTRADHSRKLAAYTHARLADIGWDAFRHEHAFTVVLKTPPPSVTARWVLASSEGWSHIVCMPGITREQIDAFIRDLKVATVTENGAARTPLRWRRVVASRPTQLDLVRPPSRPLLAQRGESSDT
jgi:histidine decarboxylase